MKKTYLLAIIGVMSLLGAGCTSDVDTAYSKPTLTPSVLTREKTTVPLPQQKQDGEASWLDVPSSNKDELARGNYLLEAIPIEFVCNEMGCSFPMVAMRWAGLGSDSVCVWSIVGGNAAVSWVEVTKDGVHNLDMDTAFNRVDSVLCKNLDGKLFYGTERTKIIPSGE